MELANEERSRQQIQDGVMAASACLIYIHDGVAFGEVYLIVSSPKCFQNFVTDFSSWSLWLKYRPFVGDL